jgi:very-short-patch-repair endonuclease
VTHHDHNRPELKEVRKKLRNQATPAEAALWKLLSGKKCGGLKFRRQHSVGPYILDFYCPEAKLAIEVDGNAHDYRI